MDMADYGILRISGDWAQSFKPQAVRIAYIFDDHRIAPSNRDARPWVSLALCLG